MEKCDKRCAHYNNQLIKMDPVNGAGLKWCDKYGHLLMNRTECVGNPVHNKIEKVPFRMAYQDDREKFIQHWSEIIGMDPDKFAKEVIVDPWDLFDDDEIIGRTTNLYEA